MIKRKQLFFHNPEKGEYGDCYRTCIACLLNYEPVQVPNFGVHYDDAEKFHQAANEFLASEGLAAISNAFLGTLEEILAMQAVNNPKAYYMLTGESKNGTRHCVICLGGEIIWDPAKDDSGIVGPVKFPGGEAYWIEYLVPSMLVVEG